MQLHSLGNDSGIYGKIPKWSVLGRLINEVSLNTQTWCTTISIAVLRFFGVPPCGRWWGGNMSWWSRRTACSHTLLLIHLAHQNMLSGINLENPSRTVTHSLSSMFSLQQYNYTCCRPQEHSLRREGAAQYSVVSPAAHVITGWKSTDARSDRDLILQHLSADVTCLCTLCCNEGGKGLWNWTAWGRSGLGTFPGLLNGIGLFSDSWCKNLHSATAKLNRQKQTT